MTPELPLVLLIPLALAGLTLVNAGLTRSRSTAHLMLASLCAAAVAMLAYLALGSALNGPYPQAWHFVGRDWNLVGGGRMFGRGIAEDDSAGLLALLFQIFCVALTALIPVAAGAERWRIGAVCASTALLAGVVYPLFAFWASPAGWLGQLGFNNGGGIASIQAVGGLNALCIVWLIGPRQGKFTSEGMPTAMPGHNATLVLFGCLLSLLGWFGLNLSGAAPILAAINTVMAASAGALAALASTRVRFGKPDASLTANGWVAGMVAIGAAASQVKPAAAILIGLIAGALVIFAIEVLELRMHVDDPAGAISVHAAGGIWGLLAVCMFGKTEFLPQLLGVATLLGFVLPFSYGLNLLLNRFLRQRVELSGERQGMDLFELGAGAYPEFVTHREDHLRR